MAPTRMAKKKTTKKKTSRGGSPSRAQREWLDKLGDFAGVGGGAEPESEQEDNGKSKGSQKLKPAQLAAFEGAVKEGFIPAIPGVPGGEIPGKVIDVIAGARAAVVRITNNSDQTLRLDSLSLREVKKIAKNQKIGISDGAEYTVLPPGSIKPNQDVEVIVTAQSTLGLSFRGAEARIRYFIDDQKTAWIMHFDNSPFSKAKGSVLLDGPNKAKFKSPKPLINNAKKSVFAFILEGEGGGGGKGKGKGKGGGGGAGPDVGSNCLITINNKTEHDLSLVDQGHDIGDFMTQPPATLAAGASCQFVSVETPGAKEEGCKGYTQWEVGTPGIGMVHLLWDNPEQKKNTTDTKIEPGNIGLRVLDQIGQGEENVPVTFTISGGGGGGGGKKPGGKKPGGKKPGGKIPKVTEEKFLPPPETKQPTLRKGDKSKDGWVEYLQSRLSVEQGSKLERDGVFSAAVHKEVIKFQKKKKLMVDGIVGNQTWASLRKDTAAPPSTDGREPGTFVEEGAEARWDQEKEWGFYSRKDDELTLPCTSVGDVDIDNFEATIRITPPDTKPMVVKQKIGKPQKKRKTGSGHLHMVVLTKFKSRFPSDPPGADFSEYLLEAYLPEKLGGDFYSDNITVI